MIMSCAFRPVGHTARLLAEIGCPQVLTSTPARMHLALVVLPVPSPGEIHPGDLCLFLVLMTAFCVFKYCL